METNSHFIYKAEEKPYNAWIKGMKHYAEQVSLKKNGGTPDLQTQALQNQGLTKAHLSTLLVKWRRKRKHQLLL